MNAKEKKEVLGIEQTIRNNKNESLHVVNSNGVQVFSAQGLGASVRLESNGVTMLKSQGKDAILTHNHPRAIGEKGIYSIGNSFSSDDIRTAVSVDAKELRAVTPTYTFSVRRPKGGWGDVNKVMAAFKKAHREAGKEGREYLSKTNWGKDQVARAEVTHFDRVMQKMSKQFGWGYSHKKG